MAFPSAPWATESSIFDSSWIQVFGELVFSTQDAGGLAPLFIVSIACWIAATKAAKAVGAAEGSSVATRGTTLCDEAAAIGDVEPEAAPDEGAVGGEGVGVVGELEAVEGGPGTAAGTAAGTGAGAANGAGAGGESMCWTAWTACWIV